MIKSIIKEVLILILLCACIILVFGIVFYKNIPLAKIVPNRVAYEAPEEIRAELEVNTETEKLTTQTITYSLTGSDLSKFINSGRLEEGKVNPFSDYTEKTNNAVITNGTASGNTFEGSYYPNTGTK